MGNDNDTDRRIDDEQAGDTLVQIWKLCETSNDSYPTLTQIARILSDIGVPRAYNGEVFDDVLRAMQNAEEISGPDGAEYISLMDKIADEATRRAKAMRERQKTKLHPMCPKCTSSAADDIEIRETYSAYHPIRGVNDNGDLKVANALGKSDFVATCRSCLHEGTPQSFGLGDPAEWDWV